MYPYPNYFSKYCSSYDELMNNDIESLSLIIANLFRDVKEDNVINSHGLTQKGIVDLYNYGCHHPRNDNFLDPSLYLKLQYKVSLAFKYLERNKVVKIKEGQIGYYELADL